jgi:predicted transposase YdaD
MTSVLYSSGLNYQSGNPVRQEIVAVRREVTSLRKQVDDLHDENLVYRKYLIKLLDGTDDSQKLMQDLLHLSTAQENSVKREAGSSTVQGGGFRR